MLESLQCASCRSDSFPGTHGHGRSNSKLAEANSVLGDSHSLDMPGVPCQLRLLLLEPMELITDSAL